MNDITLYECLAALPWLCWGMVLAGFITWVISWMARRKR